MVAQPSLDVRYTTQILAVDAGEPAEEALKQGASLLRDGELVAFATETVYGLGADATNERAVAKIFEAKGRPSTNPLIVHLADINDVKRFTATWPERASRLAEHFWPGPLTLVLPKAGAISRLASAGQETVGLRIPATNSARGLIRLAERPIAAPSANRSPGISPTRAEHVFKDLNGRIPLILDSGPTQVGIESAVVDLCHDRARLLRPGSLTVTEIQEVLGEPVDLPRCGDRDENVAFTSPGQMVVHYAPTTPTFRVEAGVLLPLIATSRHGMLQVGGETAASNDEVSLVRVLPDPATASRRLYATLHEFDEAGLDFILIVMPPPTPEWAAVRDRLTRASQPWPES